MKQEVVRNENKEMVWEKVAVDGKPFVGYVQMFFDRRRPV